MDYKRIYAEFIKDRRAKEPTLTGYTEKHHILPRSLGGGNEPENLIALTPEDHFFAHLLLAKVHNTRGMWGAVMLMLGSRHAGASKFSLRRKATKWRARYGIIKRKHALLSVGVNGANADLEDRTFYHFDGRAFTGTRIAFSERHGIPAHSVNQVVRGRSNYCGGWALSKQAARSYERERKRRAVENGRSLRGFTRCNDLHCFVHVDTGQCIVGTQRGMKELGFLCRSAASALCKGDSYVRKGWCLIENFGWASDRANKRGKYCASFDQAVHDFRNIYSGEVVKATIWEMGQRYGDGDSRQFGEVVRKRKRGARGWTLSDVNIYVPKCQSLKMQCRKTGAIDAGHVGFWKDKLGVTQSAISRHVTGRSSHVKGWSIIEKEWAPNTRAA